MHKGTFDLRVQRKLLHHAAQAPFSDTNTAAAQIDLYRPVARPRKLALDTLNGITQLGIRPLALLS
jgi:hypothetical protein